MEGLSSSLSIEEFKDYLYQAYNNSNEQCFDQLQEYYSCGNCMYLAIAFHRLYGYSIEAAIVDEVDGSFIGHAWARTSSGQCIDIMGTYDDSEEVELVSFGNRVVTNLDESNLKSYFECNPDFETDIEKALFAAKCIKRKLNMEHSLALISERTPNP